ncbi:MAG: hypothetical protein IPO83_01470 [Chitinophagaceae bacterium]|nr:hypothetical protein [Chitinophagaceae bacterium]
MKATVTTEQQQSNGSAATVTVWQMINTAIIGISPQPIKAAHDFIENRDLGDEDQGDIFEA